MTRLVLLVLGLLLLSPVFGARAQGVTGETPGQLRPNELPPVQSLQPTQSPCGPGSQSVRVCNDDFRSCNSICSPTTLDPTADIAGCTLRCCTQFKACLNIRGCASRSINCF